MMRTNALLFLVLTVLMAGCRYQHTDMFSLARAGDIKGLDAYIDREYKPDPDPSKPVRLVPLDIFDTQDKDGNSLLHHAVMGNPAQDGQNPLLSRSESVCKEPER